MEVPQRLFIWVNQWVYSQCQFLLSLAKRLELKNNYSFILVLFFVRPFISNLTDKPIRFYNIFLWRSLLKLSLIINTFRKYIDWNYLSLCYANKQRFACVFSQEYFQVKLKINYNTQHINSVMWALCM